jgi:hypothetical protein
MKTYQELKAIFLAQPDPMSALQAVYEAGRADERGEDDTSDADDYLRGLNGNYTVRVECSG